MNWIKLLDFNTDITYNLAMQKFYIFVFAGILLGTIVQLLFCRQSDNSVKRLLPTIITLIFAAIMALTSNFYEKASLEYINNCFNIMFFCSIATGTSLTWFVYRLVAVLYKKETINMIGIRKKY